MASGPHHKYKGNDVSSISHGSLPYAMPFAAQRGARLILRPVIDPFLLPSEFSCVPPEVDNADQTAMKDARKILAELWLLRLGAKCLSQASTRRGLPW